MAVANDAGGSDPVSAGVVEVPKKRGHPDNIVLALADHLPVDAMGGPVGKPTGEVVKAIRRPLGISAREWMTALEVATEYFRMTQGLVQPTKESLMAISDLPNRTWNLIYRKENRDTFEAALALKGILKKGSGLTFEQLRALRYLTDFTAPGDTQQRLKKLGISWEVFQVWMNDEKFASQYKARSEDILRQAEPDVNLALVRGAVAGRLENIKYLHQLTGKFDAAQSSDIRAFMTGLVEILTGELKENPALLMRLSERLTALKERTLGG